MSNRELLDDDGENRAVRAFLLMYGGTEGGSIGKMRRHLEHSGFENCWPEWVGAAPYNQHLTKGGAQAWIRHLFALENAAPHQSADVLGWKLVPVEPTEEMISDGFESCPDEIFSTPEVWDEYEALSGCQQAAYRARACYKAMIASAPAPADQQGEK